MAIRFNNNREFFHENHDWYVSSVREPCRQLAADLSACIQEIDPNLETRPERVVSRINRDIRFSNDKSPYRDYIWLAFRRPAADRKATMGMYFDLSDDGASFGMGIYDENRPLMNGLRRALVTEPEVFEKMMIPATEGFTLYPNAFKRMKLPDALPDRVKPWYPLRGFYVEKEIKDFGLLKSVELPGALIEGYRQLKPLYQYIAGLTPEEDPK